MHIEYTTLEGLLETTKKLQVVDQQEEWDSYIANLQKSFDVMRGHIDRQQK